MIEKLKIDREKLRAAMAAAAMNRSDILNREPELNIGAWNHAQRGNSASPRTVGLIARALGVDPAEILQDPEA